MGWIMSDLIEDLAPAIAVKLREALRPDEEVLVQLPGAFKEGLICTDSRCMIIKAGFMTGNTFGSNVFQLPYATVTSAEVKFGLMSGYFELSSGGIQNTVKSYWNNDKGSGDAKAAPNSVSLVDKKMAEKFRRASEFILARVAYSRAPAALTAPLSVADEIQKLTVLVEKGYLTQDEFAEQKRALLSHAPGGNTAPMPRAAILAEKLPEPDTPNANLDRAIAHALRDREATRGDPPAPPSRPTFGKRS